MKSKQRQEEEKTYASVAQVKDAKSQISDSIFNRLTNFVFDLVLKTTQKIASELQSLGITDQPIELSNFIEDTTRRICQYHLNTTIPKGLLPMLADTTAETQYMNAFVANGPITSNLPSSSLNSNV